MVQHYYITDIDLGEPTHSGHETYLDAVYYPPGYNSNPTKVIFKKNKYGKQEYSRLEVAFSELARLFLAKGTTSHQKLAVDHSKEIVGLVTEHMCYVIGQKEGLQQTFFTLDKPNEKCTVAEKQVSKAEDIPYYFFDKLPQGFFAQLLKAEKDNALTIDYASLASILTSSYTLEEDDLHKGNFGFYVIMKDGKPRVVFFKIDHDLMFAESIMSFNSSRPTHWIHSGNAFEITSEDLIGFPSLTHSANAYWPTKMAYLSNPWANKAYHNYEEVEAFSLLSGVPEFKKAKWSSFYKHILLPVDLIKLSLKELLKEKKAIERAQLSVIIEATLARQARLRAVLFSIKEFRDFVCSATTAERESLINEVVESSSLTEFRSQVTQSMSAYVNLCHSKHGFEEGDTPLHVAIKLGDYRYQETIHMFGQFINTPNAAGKKPLDIAFELHKISKNTGTDIRQDARFIMKHLLENGAERSEEFRRFNKKAKIEFYQFHTPYLNRVKNAKTYQEFKSILRDLGEDHTYCLKFKKNLAIQCIRQYIQVNQKNPALKAILIKLKNEINGNCEQSQHAGLKFIRQLRSRLWIVRQIRGLYGTTSTQSDINRLVDRELESINYPKEPHSFSFFSPNDDSAYSELPDDEVLNMRP
jgi:hypothetical protein